MRRIAIGCQGGGCHTAFTTGALAAIIREQLVHGDFEIVALSGTSGGAIAALLAWYGILVDGGKAALDPLDRFWREGFPARRRRAAGRPTASPMPPMSARCGCP